MEQDRVADRYFRLIRRRLNDWSHVNERERKSLIDAVDRALHAFEYQQAAPLLGALKRIEKALKDTAVTSSSQTITDAPALPSAQTEPHEKETRVRDGVRSAQKVLRYLDEVGQRRSLNAEERLLSVVLLLSFVGQELE